MTFSTVRAGIDSTTFSSSATKNFGKASSFRVRWTTAYTWLRIKSPVPAGAGVLSATLYVRQTGDVAGNVAVQCQRAAGGWDPNTVTWNTQPSTTGPITTVSKTAPTAGTWWAIDVTSHIQSWAGGAGNWGWRLAAANSATSDIGFFSSEAAGASQPYLEVTWSNGPQTPTVLVPSYGKVGLAKPVVTCDYTDHAGSTVLTSVQVQTATSSSVSAFATPAWDSGELPPSTDGVATLDLATTTFPGLTSGAANTYYRMRVKDGDGLWSGWSAAVVLARQDKGTISLDNPAAGSTPYVTDFTPPILWSTSFTQAAYQVWITTADDPRTILWNTGKVGGTVQARTVPSGVLAYGQTYIVNVRTWDAVIREATPGDFPYVSASRTFLVQYDNTVDGVTTLTAASDPTGAPVAVLTFTTPTAPDSFTITRDDVPVGVDLLPGDLFVSGTTYAWRDWGPRPERTVTYAVKRKVNGKLSAATSPTASVKIGPVGVWLWDPANPVGTSVVFSGKVDTGSQDDLAAVYQVLGAKTVTRVVMALTGLAGEVSGVQLRTRNGVSWETYQRRLNGMKSYPAKTYRLVVGAMSIPVILGDIAIRPSVDTMTGQVIQAVSFRFWQVGEYEFTANL